MRPLARMASWLVVLQLGQITVAWACSCEPRIPEELVAQPEPIVVATIVGVTDPSASPPTPAPASSDPALEDAPRSAGCVGSAVSPAKASSARTWDPLVVQVEITEVVTGDAVLGPLEVRTNRDGASCGIDAVEGETWVLQIHENDVGPYVAICGVASRIEGTDDPWLVTLRDAAAAAAP